MKLLIINSFGQVIFKESNVVPRLGDAVDLFYKPYPKVTRVLFWPSKDLLENTTYKDIDALITVD